MENEILDIKRGVYGDPVNKVLGLIDTDKEQHKRIKSLEERDKKRIWIGLGALAVIEVVIQIIKLQ